LLNNGYHCDINLSALVGNCMERGRVQDQSAFCDVPEGSTLTALDRRDLKDCEDYALALGYQNLNIHIIDVRHVSGAAELACTCRVGETWVTWVFARFKDLVVAWNALTGTDAGSYVSMSEAIHCVLLRNPTKGS
jgi:hypothetical protein